MIDTSTHSIGIPWAEHRDRSTLLRCSAWFSRASPGLDIFPLNSHIGQRHSLALRHGGSIAGDQAIFENAMNMPPIKIYSSNILRVCKSDAQGRVIFYFAVYVFERKLTKGYRMFAQLSSGESVRKGVGCLRSLPFSSSSRMQWREYTYVSSSNTYNPVFPSSEKPPAGFQCALPVTESHGLDPLPTDSLRDPFQAITKQRLDALFCFEVFRFSRALPWYDFPVSVFPHIFVSLFSLLFLGRWAVQVSKNGERR